MSNFSEIIVSFSLALVSLLAVFCVFAIFSVLVKNINKSVYSVFGSLTSLLRIKGVILRVISYNPHLYISRSFDFLTLNRFKAKEEERTRKQVTTNKIIRIKRGKSNKTKLS